METGRYLTLHALLGQDGGRVQTEAHVARVSHQGHVTSCRTGRALPNILLTKQTTYYLINQIINQIT